MAYPDSLLNFYFAIFDRDLPAFFGSRLPVFFLSSLCFPVFYTKYQYSGKQDNRCQAENTDRKIPADSSIIAAVTDYSECRCNGVQVCKCHISGSKHSAISIDKCDNDTNEKVIRPLAGNYNDWQNGKI